MPALRSAEVVLTNKESMRSPPWPNIGRAFEASQRITGLQMIEIKNNSNFYNYIVENRRSWGGY
jgi:hypothetical protein